VTDVELPTIACPSDITTTNDLGQCGAIVTYAAPVGTDDCSSATTMQTSGLASGSLFPVGKTTNTFEVTDAAGNMASCSFIVLVSDIEPPSIVCLSDISATNDLGQCGAIVNYLAPAGTDNCPGSTTMQTGGLVSGSFFPVGKTTNTFKVTDAAGNTATCSFVVIVTDAEAPIIGSITASESQSYSGTVDVKNCFATTLQGTVDFTIQASDSCALAAAPTLVLTNGAATEIASFAGESPAGSFHYTWSVDDATTVQGTWHATVTAMDNVGNAATSAFMLCVDKAQITGQVELESFVGANRVVTFTATGGTSTKTWDLPLNFSGGVATYTLTEVPSGTTGISAKTAWNLRRKLAVTLDSDGQGTANFTASNELRGGDLNGDNIVNLLDYSILQGNWHTTNAAADIDGSGSVGTLDYSILKNNWRTQGDAP
jgi:hypothetical protein